MTEDAPAPDTPGSSARRRADDTIDQWLTRLPPHHWRSNRTAARRLAPGLVRELVRLAGGRAESAAAVALAGEVMAREAIGRLEARRRCLTRPSRTGGVDVRGVGWCYLRGAVTVRPDGSWTGSRRGPRG